MSTMSFIAPSENIAQDYQRSTSFSLAPEAFGTAGSLDLNLDLEKQQQHHLRQFLYFQGLALQRSEERQRSLAVSETFDGINHIHHDTRPSPDTLSSGSVEDRLHDFITIESLSDTSVSTPSTPDLLGTNIPSLPSRSFPSSDLDLSPSSVVQTPAYSMTGAPSPLQDANAIAAGCIPHDVQSQIKVTSLQPFDQFGTYTHALPSSAQFPLYYQQAVEMPPLIQHATSKVTIDTTPPMLATATRQRSFSVAGTLPSSYAQSAMSPYYVSGHPASYHQLCLAGYIPAQPDMFSESAMAGMDANQHQRTFSLPAGSLPMHFNPSTSLPPTERVLAFDSTLDSDSIAFDSRRSSLVAMSAPSHRKAQEQRSKPYDRAGQTSSRSPPCVSEHDGTSKSRKPSLNAECSGQESSLGSSIPASIIPESLKDLPASMIRNPHGGGRGYVPGETQEDPKKRHKCGICGRGFARLYNLKSHALTHDPARPKPHECPHAKCSRSFSRLHDLERHRQGIHRDGPLMEAKEQGIAPAVARANTRIAKRAADSDSL